MLISLIEEEFNLGTRATPWTVIFLDSKSFTEVPVATSLG